MATHMWINQGSRSLISWRNTKGTSIREQREEIRHIKADPKTIEREGWGNKYAVLSHVAQLLVQYISETTPAVFTTPVLHRSTLFLPLKESPYITLWLYSPVYSQLALEKLYSLFLKWGNNGISINSSTVIHCLVTINAIKDFQDFSLCFLWSVTFFCYFLNCLKQRLSVYLHLQVLAWRYQIPP